ncbi:unnamed protein product [Clavelina lepadiformis]|uniref:Fibronectin type-III domain-containing protein n=1 Tax=Clavelina lepadiformis TaxID=159417 RepID=A0ABP0GG44_CLALP
MVESIALNLSTSPAPTDVQISNIGSTRFDIIWQHDTIGELQPTIRYRAFYKPAQSSLPSVYKDTVGFEKTLTISGLTPSTSYQVGVKALTSDSKVVSNSSPNVIATTENGRQSEVYNYCSMREEDAITG